MLFPSLWSFPGIFRTCKSNINCLLLGLSQSGEITYTAPDIPIKGDTEERFSSKEEVSHQTFIRSFDWFLKIRVYANHSLQFVSDLGLTIAAILSDVQNYLTVGS
jgi:hypothetical protein